MGPVYVICLDHEAHSFIRQSFHLTTPLGALYDA